MPMRQTINAQIVLTKCFFRSRW